MSLPTNEEEANSKKTGSCDITIVKPGPCLLLQDLGRQNSQLEGFSPSGAADEQAYLWANHLLGNTPNSTCLEITSGPCVIDFHSATHIALCGAATNITINKNTVSTWQKIFIEPNSQLIVSAPRHGLRTYLAVSGGLQSEKWFKSASMVTRENSGPFYGKPLQAKQTLYYENKPTNISKIERVPRTFIPDYNQDITCNIAACYDPSFRRQPHESDSHSLEPQSLGPHRLLLEKTFTIHSDSNRMAIKLCEKLEIEQDNNKPEKNHARYSEGTCLGAIQLPPDGNPIILLKDRQTIGGYPHVATVDPRDAFRLSQCQPGTKIRFSESSFEAHHKNLRGLYTFFGV